LRTRFFVSTLFAEGRVVLAAWAVPLLAVFLAGIATADEEIHWSYSGEHGPEHWGELSEAFEACSDGVNQSPVDLADPVKADLGPIAPSYGGSAVAAINNGHTLQIEVGPGNSLDIDGQEFELLQFHLHSPSEHRIEGKSFPLEAHFVHQNGRGELAVLAVLFRDGPPHAGLAKIGETAPRQIGRSEPFDVSLADLGLVLTDRDYYRYSGSLTTPPCTEGVMWLVLKSTSHVARAQVEGFVQLIGKDAREPQPLNGRAILH